jgi:hypothetical protein
VAELRRRGGGVIHTYYHPTEFIATEFWDGVNFPRGKYTPPSQYKPSPLRTRESSEKAYRLALDFARHVKKTPGIRIITARQLPDIFRSPLQPADAAAARRHFRDGIDMMGDHSAADLLLAMLGMKPQPVDGPSLRKQSMMRAATIPRELFERGKRDAVAYIAQYRRLPSHVWFGSEYLSLADFAATLAADNGAAGVTVHEGRLVFEKHIATDAQRSFNWAIHPHGFSAPELLELGRMQAWTLKPARLK